MSNITVVKTGSIANWITAAAAVGIFAVVTKVASVVVDFITYEETEAEPESTLDKHLSTISPEKIDPDIEPNEKPKSTVKVVRNVQIARVKVRASIKRKIQLKVADVIHQAMIHENH